MKFEHLLEHIEYKLIQGSTNIEISTLEKDSRLVQKDSVYVCIKGVKADGHHYIEEAVLKGASVIVTEQEMELPYKVTHIHVRDSRYALAFMAAAYFGYPADKLKIIGITGTKGKTTCAYMIKAILESAGYKTGLIGTIETSIGEETYPSINTTPESLQLHRYFRRMVQKGCEYVVMEVSSQALMLKRTAGITFEIGVFTNLSADHIGPGEHTDFAQYKQCKKRLFQQCKCAIANMDDPSFFDMFKETRCKLITYGFSNEANFHASDMEPVIQNGRLGTICQVEGKTSMPVQLSIPGIFGIYNALVAIAVGTYYHISSEIIQMALKNVSVKGRTEIIQGTNGYTVVLDYAHNAISLQNLLRTMKDYRPKRLISLFGCGGNRAKMRRYQMGEISGKMADLTIVTSDNPRFERPEDIIEDICIGIKKVNGSYIAILDRKEAIRYALLNAREGDILVITGKGHENYQEIQGKKIFMDDKVIVESILKEIKVGACTSCMQT